MQDREARLKLGHLSEDIRGLTKNHNDFMERVKEWATQVDDAFEKGFKFETRVDHHVNLRHLSLDWAIRFYDDTDASPTDVLKTANMFREYLLGEGAPLPDDDRSYFDDTVLDDVPDDEKVEPSQVVPGHINYLTPGAAFETHGFPHAENGLKHAELDGSQWIYLENELAWKRSDPMIDPEDEVAEDASQALHDRIRDIQESSTDE